MKSIWVALVWVFKETVMCFQCNVITLQLKHTPSNYNGDAKVWEKLVLGGEIIQGVQQIIKFYGICRYKIACGAK